MWFGTECFVFNFEADPDPGNEDLLIFKQKKNFKISLVCFFFCYFYAKTWWTIKRQGIFIISLFQLRFRFWEQMICVCFFVDILPYRFGSVDPHMDPDSERQNVADLKIMKISWSLNDSSRFCIKISEKKKKDNLTILLW